VFDAHPDQTTFLLVATPGAGKTALSAYLSSRMRVAQRIRNVVVVTPTVALKKQWTKAMSSIGIELDAEFRNGLQLARDYHGIIATYSQVCSAPGVFRKQCEPGALVILDEPHHAGEEREWGRKIDYAFNAAHCRLLLSGTPFRTDGRRIPFVTYAEDGYCQPDFEYSYRHALMDQGVCREVVFQTFGGEVSYAVDGETIVTNFDEDVDERRRSERLRTALMAQLEWLPEVIRQADRRVDEVRAQGHINAGGLVLAIDQDHARKIASLITEATGERPALVISDDPDAPLKIKAFERSRQRWLVAVRMVSEGIDIKRLRVLLFAANATTRLFFRQAVGRVVRWDSELNCPQSAYVFLPRDPMLTQHAREMEEDLRYRFEKAERDAVKLGSDDDELGGGRPVSTYVPIGASANLGEAILTDGESISPEELMQAELFCAEVGADVPIEQAVRFYRYAKQQKIAGRARKKATPESETVSLLEKKRALRRQCRTLVSQLARATNEDHRSINRRLAEVTGTFIDDASLSQLERRRDSLLSQLKAASRRRTVA
jgi:superfamily II DNA or RNA helicase